MVTERQFDTGTVVLPLHGERKGAFVVSLLDRLSSTPLWPPTSEHRAAARNVPPDPSGVPGGTSTWTWTWVPPRSVTVTVCSSADAG